jgi:hypothetical protein
MAVAWVLLAQADRNGLGKPLLPVPSEPEQRWWPSDPVGDSRLEFRPGGTGHANTDDLPFIRED